MLEDQFTREYLTRQYCELVISCFRSEILTINDSSQLRNLYESIPILSFTDTDGSLIDYQRELLEVYETALKNLNEILRITTTDKSVKIREKFGLVEPSIIESSIESIPENTEFDTRVKLELKKLFSKFSTIRTGTEPSEPALGTPRKAFLNLAERYRKAMQTLFSVLQQDPTLQRVFDVVLNKAREFQIRLQALERSNSLTREERAYIQAIQRLTLANPALVASIRANPVVTREYLRDHFDRISNRLIDTIQDGDYIPLIHIGLGPNGIAAIAKIAELSPELSRDMLCVDAAKNVGGPFGVPGPNWRLNSANAEQGKFIPRDAAILGSKFGFNPGERSVSDSDSDSDGGRGDINIIIDFGITLSQTTPDVRYATNEDLALLLSVLLSTISERVALQTRVIKIEPNTEEGTKGDKIVTLEITTRTGIRIVRIKTDAIVAATGLGDPTYGFELQGTNAETIISGGNQGFKRNLKILTTLQAFEAAGAEGDFSEFSFGKTVVIYGGGDSAQTLLERLGRLFSPRNISSSLSSIRKIYVITDKSLAERPRYRQLCDLFDRNGKEGLVTIINSRVSDISQSENGMLNFFDSSGSLITTPNGESISADTAIAATGFEDKFRQVIEEYDRNFGGTGNLEPVTSEGFNIGLKGRDPRVLVLGVAARNIIGPSQLERLSEGARAALGSVREGNAVAIGFNTAAAQEYIDKFLTQFSYSPTESGPQSKVTIINLGDTEDVLPPDAEIQSPLIGPINILKNLRQDDILTLLNAEFFQLFRNSISLTSPTSPEDSSTKKFNGVLEFEVNKFDNGSFLVKNRNNFPVNQLLVNEIINIFLDEKIRTYLFYSFDFQRYPRPMLLRMKFLNGILDPKTSFIE